ncbi:bi-domain-containing oxidoreductase [Magnetofaba australis]|uniref:Putative inositol 2-dehydrogenase n=1 Tax=Magnetofaba australis IT-1 TaxID=1434232 RepID=A0A1Y2K1Z8_9PROT|nr:bi-domain-containing oxidoreductase [Magnetofaba australis]OSM00222.1 putative inositol 2-dehydrogenase [Magnetofaba australis IT-1]
MKQILLNLKNGQIELTEAPCPQVEPGTLLIQTARTLVSAGTERMLVSFGSANLAGKALQQQDKVKQVLEKAATDGWIATYDAVRHKLDQRMPLGYCNVGRVIAVGDGVEGFAVGDRVASNGPHAEVARVPKHLCARVPDGVTDEQAAFTVMGAIALQGVRLAMPTLGEAFVVIGLGLVGLMSVQLLRANGCRVLGVDLDAERCALAESFGAQTVNPASGADPLAAALRFSRGRGVDGVLVAAATDSDEPMRNAARMCRKRGRIVLVGVTGLNLSRDDFFKKEITFQVSASYGPGRYDPLYEEKGQDYPVGFVRWTEQRNFEAVLDMMAEGRLQPEALITRRLDLEEAEQTYRQLAQGGGELGALLRYPRADAPAEAVTARRVALPVAAGAAAQDAVRVGFIGIGNYAARTLAPAFKAAGAQLLTVASSRGLSSVQYGRQLGFAHAASDADEVLRDPQVNLVAIATRHDTHADLVTRALAAGKHVFVEKPLALTDAEVDAIEGAYAAARQAGGAPQVMVGFNRRFAPQIVRMRELMQTVAEPKAMIMTVNAGHVPAENWLQDRAAGGGRIIGEACHFIDLLRHLSDAPIVDIQAQALGAAHAGAIVSDRASLMLRFEDGSLGSIHYLANGSKAFPKERLEVFCAGRVLQLDNFRRLRGYGWPGFGKMNLWRQDKGNAACVAASVASLRNGEAAPIPFDQIVQVSRAAIAADRLVTT